MNKSIDSDFRHWSKNLNLHILIAQYYLLPVLHHGILSITCSNAVSDTSLYTLVSVCTILLIDQNIIIMGNLSTEDVRAYERKDFSFTHHSEHVLIGFTQRFTFARHQNPSTGTIIFFKLTALYRCHMIIMNVNSYVRSLYNWILTKFIWLHWIQTHLLYSILYVPLKNPKYQTPL